MNKASLGNVLQTVRAEDFVEYFLFPQLPDEIEAIVDPVEKEQRIEEHLTKTLTKCRDIVNELVAERNYIWHKDEFMLEIRTGSAREKQLASLFGSSNDDEALPPHFYGVTHYGENISDEWFIVFLVVELTRQVSGLIGRLVDSDEEFLLIEAADALPKWANPETCSQRVYIVDGFVQLVQSSPCNTARIISVGAALEKIRLNSTLYRVSNDMQKCVMERLKEFSVPYQNLHRQILRLPLGVAAILKRKPQLIAAAVRAFCDRDTIDLKACRSMRFFPPEQRVRTNVCLTRCLYAMLMHSNYTPDRKTGWNLSSGTNTDAYKEDLLGVKVACGFEILATRGKQPEDEREWRAYVKSLTGMGYFNANLEGSEDYNRLMAEARAFFTRTQQRYRTQPLVGREILDMISSSELKFDELYDEENNLPPSESDDWLNISVEELDSILQDRYGARKLCEEDAAADMCAEDFAKKLSEFLEKESEFDGIDNAVPLAGANSKAKGRKARPSTPESATKNVSAAGRATQSSRASQSSQPTQSTGADDDNGHTHVRNFLDFVIPEDTWDSNSEMSDYEDEKDLEHTFEAMTKTMKNMKMDIKAYMDEMDKELAQTTVGQTFHAPGDATSNPMGNASGANASAEDDFNDIESFEPVNINVNILKNMMYSYKSQIGSSGPVSNLLNAMGSGMGAADSEQGEKDDTAPVPKDLTESSV